MATSGLEIPTEDMGHPGVRPYSGRRKDVQRVPTSIASRTLSELIVV